MEVIADKRYLETHGFISKLLRILIVPLLNNLPAKIVQMIMRLSSHDARIVLEQKGSTHALEVMYTRYHRSLFSQGVLRGFADLFWHHIVSQPKALRNRLKIVEENLEIEIKKLLNSTLTKEEIRILTVGGGSARAIFQTLQKVNTERADTPIKVINIDKDEKAIEFGRTMAEKSLLHPKFEWINSDAQSILYFIEKDSIHIVEMVGLLDYFSEEKGVEVISQIHKVLKPGGLFIVANVYPNSETSFVTKTGWPHMYYRRPADVERILHKAKFSAEPLIIFEPLKVHLIALVRK